MPLTRRGLLAGGIASVAGALPAFAQEPSVSVDITIADTGQGPAISPHVFGSNEIGVMDGGRASADLDREAGVTIRRLGGDLLTGYNWQNNAAHAGKNHRHANGAFLLEALQVPRSRWSDPAAVIEAMHDASLAMGARSFLTLPLAGHVAADFFGPVAEGEAAPSSRFLPVDWTRHPRAKPVDATCNMPRLIETLMDRYGDSTSGRGFLGYALDNEPGIWFQTHPRIMPKRITIRAFIERSVSAAKVIKSLDPGAKVFGPCSWGATEMVSFQSAPDWGEYRKFGTFLGAYLDAFREASERSGQRLLDMLDVHWYPFSARGKLFRTEDAALDSALLEAPRGLSEAGFREDSWVTRALADRGPDALTFPILPGLKRLTDRFFPGTEIAITEFNYGGAGRLATGLALADVLGRYCAAGVAVATHWGSLNGWIGEAYRLYRMPDMLGGRFSGHMLPIKTPRPEAFSAFASREGDAIRVVAINKLDRPCPLILRFTGGPSRRFRQSIGFDGHHVRTGEANDAVEAGDGQFRITLPARSARRLLFS